MTAGFIGYYVLVLLAVGLLLFGLWSVVSALGRGRFLKHADRRLVSVVETTALAPNTTLHVVKIAEKYYAIGGGSGHLSLLCELPTEQVTPWIDEQRRIFKDQKAQLGGFIKYLRRPHP